MHEGETVVVLTRGAERAEYADAFLWAAQQLGAATYHMRLPSPHERVRRVGGRAIRS